MLQTRGSPTPTSGSTCLSTAAWCSPPTPRSTGPPCPLPPATSSAPPRQVVPAPATRSTTTRNGRGAGCEFAAIRSLGRSGIAHIIDDCCDHARRLTAGTGALPGAEVLREAQINQGLVRFTDPGGDHDS